MRLGCRDRVTGVEDDAPLVGGGRSELLEERLLRSGGGQNLYLPFIMSTGVGVVMRGRKFTAFTSGSFPKVKVSPPESSTAAENRRSCASSIGALATTSVRIVSSSAPV